MDVLEHEEIGFDEILSQINLEENDFSEEPEYEMGEIKEGEKDANNES